MKELYHNLNSAFWLYFYIRGGQGTEWLDLGIPMPSYLKHANTGYFIGYAISGFFGTKAGKKYLSDVIVRFIKTFEREGLEVEKLPYKPPLDEKRRAKDAHVIDVIYNLIDISEYLEHFFEDEKRRKKEFRAVAMTSKKTEDALFDAIRFTVYEFVKANGKSCLTLEYVQTIADLAYEQIGSSKGYSTVKAKAKAVYEWVMEHYHPGGVNNWNYVRKTENDEELYKLRAEQCKKNAKKSAEKRSEKAKEKVFKAIEELKDKNEKISVRKVAKLAKVSTNTARKYIRIFEE